MYYVLVLMVNVCVIELDVHYMYHVLLMVNVSAIELDAHVLCTSTNGQCMCD